MTQLIIQYLLFIIIILTPVWIVGELYKAYLQHKLYHLAKDKNLIYIANNNSILHQLKNDLPQQTLIRTGGSSDIFLIILIFVGVFNALCLIFKKII